MSPPYSACPSNMSRESPRPTASVTEETNSTKLPDWSRLQYKTQLLQLLCIIHEFLLPLKRPTRLLPPSSSTKSSKAPFPSQLPFHAPRRPQTSPGKPLRDLSCTMRSLLRSRLFTAPGASSGKSSHPTAGNYPSLPSFTSSKTTSST